VWFDGATPKDEVFPTITLQPFERPNPVADFNRHSPDRKPLGTLSGEE
jgi:hypothetical protein